MNCDPFHRVVKDDHEIEITVLYLGGGKIGFLISVIASQCEPILYKILIWKPIKPNIFCEEIKQQLISFYLPLC